MNFLQIDKESNIYFFFFFFFFFFWGGGGWGEGSGGGYGGGSEHNVQMFKMALLLFKEYKCAKLFRNTCLNTEEMAQTSSINDHFIIWPSSVSLTFNFPKQVL